MKVIKNVSVAQMADRYAITESTLYRWSKPDTKSFKDRLRRPTKTNPNGLTDSEIEEMAYKTELQFKHLKLGCLCSMNGIKNAETLMEILTENEQLIKRNNILTREVAELAEMMEHLR